VTGDNQTRAEIYCKIVGDLYSDADLATQRRSQPKGRANCAQSDCRRRNGQEAFAQAGGHRRFELSRGSQKSTASVDRTEITILESMPISRVARSAYPSIRQRCTLPNLGHSDHHAISLSGVIGRLRTRLPVA